MERILEIYERALAGKATEGEMNILRSWLAGRENNGPAQELLEQSFFRTTATVDIPEEKAQAIFQAIITADKTPDRVRHIFPRRWWWAAASVALLLAASAAYYLLQEHQTVRAPAVADVAPAHKGAILTLSDGSQVVLDSAKNGLVASQNGARILLDSGQLSYDPVAGSADAITYNAISTPKGRQFNLQLPDGTQVWLNAASSIRYPTLFKGAERKVEITGEAYFEVAQNSKMPFRINVNKQALIEVLGTSFNINAYGDNGTINTTLISGTVAVKHTPIKTSSSERVILKPGQTAQMAIAHDLNTVDKIKVIPDADINKAVAWKNGAFNLEGSSLKEVMKEVERWYDIEVVYENNKIPDIYFTGEMSRNVKLSSFLKALKEWQINYRLDNNRLIILP
ncbi:FecR protein [Chitinophaga eiseniae]|uniref:FecR protein n=1 Tax=Chitinophaga eiseniae TaxID=634771 RepID=A0A1T4SML2_9BACT|nr:FecR family protein [Chitinophaga eiseniae]SKA29469.1 FecR protein [Chitinophaga eiseniae]